MTVAIGRCMSDPISLERDAGSNPMKATDAVINTGRNLEDAPCMTDSLIPIPLFFRLEIWLTNKIPCIEAIPKSVVDYPLFFGQQN